MANNFFHRLLKTKILFSFLFQISFSLCAQEKFSGLEKLEVENLSCYYSEGSEDKARKISAFCSKAIIYFEKKLNFKPQIDILVLGADDWKYHTSFPVYGMPHYTGKETLIVAADDNPFWKSFIPAEGSLSSTLMSKIKEVYTNDKGEISMEAFFELLVIHELGHAYTQQAGIKMQRQWLGEFFPNLMLHSFVAEADPEKLPALTLFPEIVIGGGKKNHTYTTLQQLENNYQFIATQHPENYGWYQCRWHEGAAEVYDSGGKDLLLKFWNAFKENDKEIIEEDMAEFLEISVHPAMADFYRNWNND